jgi:hypothetical protein
MKKPGSRQDFDGTKFAALERAGWRDSGLLTRGSLTDFQKLADDVFLDLKRRYYRPADLVVELKQQVQLNTRRKPSISRSESKKRSRRD